MTEGVDQQRRQHPPVVLGVAGEPGTAPVPADQVHQAVDAAMALVNPGREIGDGGRVREVGDVRGDTRDSGGERFEDRWLYSTATTVAPAACRAEHTAGPAAPAAPVTSTTRPPGPSSGDARRRRDHRRELTAERLVEHRQRELVGQHGVGQALRWAGHRQGLGALRPA